MTNLVLQSFGKESEYKRAIFTILSYYAYNSLPLAQTNVVLFTDQPDYFKPYLHTIPVQYVLLTEEKIRQMRGQIDFLHRMKIALIEEAFSLTEGNVIYADSDTFFMADPTPLVEQLSPGISFMHVREYPFESMRNADLPAGKSSRAFLKLMESKTFQLTSGVSVRYSSESYSWNAGVMMFHPSHSKFIPDVYALTDQFYPPTLSHASEQYAFSLVLQQRTEVKPCDAVIYHYWYRIKKQIIDLFLADHLNTIWAQKSFPDKLNEIKEWCSFMPVLFEKHILTLKDDAIQAFNNRRFLIGYWQAIKALSKTPFDTGFMKDILYHTKRWIKA